MIKIYSAPMQGHTEGEWRQAHRSAYEVTEGIADRYFTPFLRLEHGEVRKRDLRGLEGICNGEEGNTSVQIIFRDAEEFRTLTETVVNAGCRAIDLNLGCPFPMQTRKGRGSAMIERPEVLAEVSALMRDYPEITWSAKMRLGMTNPDAWEGSAGVLAEMQLRWMTVHPRTADQGYKGDLYLEEFEKIMTKLPIPIVFNGDVKTPEDIAGIEQRWPGLHAVMVGRGLQSRPSMIAEYRGGEEWSHGKRIENILRLHTYLYENYNAVLEGGDHQVIAKLMPFWEYLEDEIGHKAYKQIKKSKIIEGYLKNVKDITN